jgi:hypothetical protein
VVCAQDDRYRVPADRRADLVLKLAIAGRLCLLLRRDRIAVVGRRQGTAASRRCAAPRPATCPADIEPARHRRGATPRAARRDQSGDELAARSLWKLSWQCPDVRSSPGGKLAARPLSPRRGPVHALGSVTDSRIEAVAGIEAPVVLNERGLCHVEMTDIVFGGILCSARIQQFPHTMLRLERVVAFADYIILMKRSRKNAHSRACE